MRRATTPIHTFTFPEDVPVGEVSDVKVTYSQERNIILEKTLKDMAVDTENNAMAVALTEDESNLFAPGKALIQVRAKVGDGALSSQMIWMTVKPVLNSEDI